MRSTALKLASMTAVAALFAAVAVVAVPPGSMEAQGPGQGHGPPLQAGPHTPEGPLHEHYIIKGNGECMVLNAPAMVPALRGLHHGANMSSGATPGPDGPFGVGDERGPWHDFGEPDAGFGCPNGD